MPTTWAAEAGESLEPGRWRLQWADIMPMASGSIMAVVAVLLIHIDRKAVTAKSARTDTSMLFS